MKRRSRALWKAVLRSEVRNIALLAVLLCSCNLFDTRDPQPPVNQTDVYDSPTNTTMVLTNLTRSVQGKNLQEYSKLFADSSFRFIPTQSAAARYGLFFQSWEKTAESGYFRNVLAEIPAASSPQLALTPTATVLFQNDSAVVTVDYVLFVPHNRTTVKQFTGRSDMYMAPSKTGLWSIYRWVDQETKKDSSWSELKGQFTK